MLILAINPGSTSTKTALFENTTMLFDREVQHQPDDLKKFKWIYEQQDYRTRILHDFLATTGTKIGDIDCFVGRGGLVRPCPAGTYEVCDEMLADLKDMSLWGREHASNLGAMIAAALAREQGKRAFIVDPIVVDELSDLAHLSGYAPIPTKSVFHCLNVRARCHRYAAAVGKKIGELNLVCAHMGGGISVALMQRGRIVDVNNALLGVGPFTPQRCGALPVGDLVDLCYSGKFASAAELKQELVKRGGLISYLGTDSIPEIRRRIADGDHFAEQVVTAMAYQISKSIGALSAAAHGDIDAIILTGGMARDSVVIIPYLKKAVSRIAPVVVYEGEEEACALASGVYRVLTGAEELRDYRRDRH